MNKKNLVLRIVSSLVLAPIVIAAVYFGQFYFLSLIAIVVVIALIEFRDFVRSRDNNIHLVLLSVLSILLLYTFYLGDFQSIIFILLTVFLLIATVVLFTKMPAVFERLSYHFFALFYISVSLGLLVYIREHFYKLYNLTYIEGSYFLMLVLINIWLSDIFAYFGGSLFGKHKLYSAVSPNKTIEGSVIGFVVSVFVSVNAFLAIFDKFSLLFTICLSSLIAVATQIGDLFESKIKRDLGIKDSGTIIPGHGGILDRIDSILFVFPFVFLFIEITNFILKLGF